MEAFHEEYFQHLKHFNLEEIKSITGDFDKNNLIGEGGFGKVYGGVISDSKGQIMAAAFKRLDNNCGQGNPEFLKEIIMLSCYTHENLISLMGFCDEDGEKVLVYERASHGSLDSHLSSTTLTWTQRLKICLGAARGLCYLHDPKETQQRVIHRDIKSSNILIDENWNAKVSDMGLSKIGPANQWQSFLVTNVVGTFFYIDPAYMETNILTKESDVYSFGVVLFEVLCGSLCFEKNNNHFQSLVRRWKKSYKEKKLDEIVFHHLKEGMDLRSLDTFSEIAYQCLKKSRVERPNMSQVVEKLEMALHIQQDISKMEFEEMVKAAVSKEELDMLLSKSFLKKEELEMFLSKGILVNGGNTWFSLNQNGQHCQMISAECFIPRSNYSPKLFVPYSGANKSRFEVHNRKRLYNDFKAHVRPQFLSPDITYTVNLVFKFVYRSAGYLGLNYRLAGEKSYLTTLVTHERRDGWFMAELYQFISKSTTIDLEIEFSCLNLMEVEGIEFHPLEIVQDELLFEDEEVDLLPDTYWEQKLPSDYKDIIKKSRYGVQWTTNKELYSIFCKGFLINDGEEWFSLAKNGKTCHMISAILALKPTDRQWKWQYLAESRFRRVAFNPVGIIEIHCRSDELSPQTTYATYLIYKLQKNSSLFELPILCQRTFYDGHPWNIYLLSPQASVITGKVYQKKRVPKQRNDGWMEVQIYEFDTDTQGNEISFRLRLSKVKKSLIGLTVLGIEFKPV